MDHYKTLGLSRVATKEEIKEAFRRSALNFHPDRHAQSSEALRHRSIIRFKQASEAYEVLIDDRKRADYDSVLRQRERFGKWSAGASPDTSAGYAGGGGYPKRSAGGGGSALNGEYLFRILTTRGFLMSLAFGSLLLGGAVMAERSVDRLWKLNNTGKSFEDAMESIEKRIVDRPCKLPSNNLHYSFLPPRNDLMKGIFKVQACRGIQKERAVRVLD
ncbi:Chaperone protein dnaJ 72 [Platanthera guangdongensis]|uniref:Chaperone protein dnaJ 72 n=1 Tax=Platanthera guangdongensis TaxID=2320717 RepID=A0ABR2LYM9_9ASPA